MPEILVSLFLVFVLFPAFLTFAAYLCYTGSNDLRKMYAIITSKPQPIGGLTDQRGPIEVEGTAVPTDEHDTVTALFTSTDCLAYTYSAEAPLGAGPADAPRSDHGDFDVLDEGSDYTGFYVEDETGRALVDPTDARFEFTPEYHYNAPLSDTPEPVEEYMQRNPETQPPETVIHPVLSHLVNTHHQFVEQRLDIGDTVYIRGYAQEPTGWDTDDEPLVSGGPEDVDFVVYDRSKRRTALWYGLSGSWEVIGGIVLGIIVLVLLPGIVQTIL